MPSVSIQASELVRMLNNALQAAYKDKSLPIINAALVKWADGKFTVTATDRYILLRETMPAEVMDGEGQLILPVSEIKSLVKVIGKPFTPVLADLRLEGGQAECGGRGAWGVHVHAGA